jgi:hypothetical protein
MLITNLMAVVSVRSVLVTSTGVNKCATTVVSNASLAVDLSIVTASHARVGSIK